jgi:hypothetical protein
VQRNVVDNKTAAVYETIPPIVERSLSLFSGIVRIKLGCGEGRYIAVDDVVDTLVHS